MTSFEINLLKIFPVCELKERLAKLLCVRYTIRTPNASVESFKSFNRNNIKEIFNQETVYHL